jgi:hypothetical protein
MFWTFNLSPTFMSLPSDYKTLGLRNIEVQPVVKVKDVLIAVYLRKEFNVYEVAQDADGDDVRGDKIEDDSAFQHVIFCVDELSVDNNVGMFCAKVEKALDEFIDEWNIEHGYIKGDLGWIKKPVTPSPPPTGEEEEDEELIVEDENTIELMNCYAKVTYDRVYNKVVFQIISRSFHINTEEEELLYFISVQPSMSWIRDQIDAKDRKKYRDDLVLFDHERERFYMFLNQDIPADNAPIAPLSYRQEFLNVWNYENLYIHASFSMNEYGYLGSENEFYTRPSKLYKYDGRSPDIRLWASLDGKNPIILNNIDFTVELELICNVKYPNQY